MKEPMIVIREGLVFDFPESTSVIVDPMCRQLSGFVGARWCAHELYLTPEEVKEIYGCDVSKNTPSMMSAETRLTITQTDCAALTAMTLKKKACA